MTITTLLQQAQAQLKAVSDTARLDAEVLLCHVLKCQRSYLYTWPHKTLTSPQQQQFYSLLIRRQQGEPVAYLTGQKEFWSLTLKVTKDTLIPRPETECLLEWIVKHLPGEQPLEIADLGTGSGAIALALAKECPAWCISASDQSSAALQVAKQNAAQWQLNNVHFYQGSWCDALPHHHYDVIVSNPPYIASEDPHLKQGDLNFEPLAALASGVDGLDAIRCIIKQAPHYLRPGGYLLIEHGHDQASAVLALLREMGFVSCQSQQDLSGLARFVVARRRS